MTLRGRGAGGTTIAPARRLATPTRGGTPPGRPAGPDPRGGAGGDHGSGRSPNDGGDDDDDDDGD